MNKKIVIITVIFFGLIAQWLNLYHWVKVQSYEFFSITKISNNLNPISNIDTTLSIKKTESKVQNQLIPDLNNKKVRIENENSHNSLNRVQVEFKKCFPNLEVPKNFHSIIKSMSHLLSKPEINVKNWHLILPNGIEKRLMLVPRDSDNKAFKKVSQMKMDMEIREFLVDNEGLPIPIHSNSLNNSGRVNELLSQGKITFTSEQINYKLTSGGSVNILTENSYLKSIELHTNQSAFLCQSNSSCICKQISI